MIVKEKVCFEDVESGRIPAVVRVERVTLQVRLNLKNLSRL